MLSEKGVFLQDKGVNKGLVFGVPKKSRVSDFDETEPWYYMHFSIKTESISIVKLEVESKAAKQLRVTVAGWDFEGNKIEKNKY